MLYLIVIIGLLAFNITPAHTTQIQNLDTRLSSGVVLPKTLSSKDLIYRGGLGYRKFINIPFSGNSLNIEKIINFRDLIKDNNEKSLFFCRSGARSSIIWGIASVLYLGADLLDSMAKINDIGYDSSSLPDMVEYFKIIK